MLYKKYVKSNNITNVVSRLLHAMFKELKTCSINNALICPGGFPLNATPCSDLKNLQKFPIDH